MATFISERMSTGHEGTYCVTIEIDGIHQEFCMPMELYHKALEMKYREIENKTVRELKGSEALNIIKKYGIKPSGAAGVDK